MDELAGTENRIAVERMRYNESVQEYQHLAAAVPGEPHRGALPIQGSTRSSRAPPEAGQVPKVNFKQP